MKGELFEVISFHREINVVIFSFRVLFLFPLLIFSKFL